MNKPDRLRKEDFLLAVSLAVLGAADGGQTAQAPSDVNAAVASWQKGTTMGYQDRRSLSPAEHPVAIKADRTRTGLLLS